MKQTNQAFVQSASNAVGCINCDIEIIQLQLARLEQAIINDCSEEYLGAKIAIGISARRIIRVMEQIDDIEILARIKKMYWSILQKLEKILAFIRVEIFQVRQQIVYYIEGADQTSLSLFVAIWFVILMGVITQDSCQECRFSWCPDSRCSLLP